MNVGAFFKHNLLMVKLLLIPHSPYFYKIQGDGWEALLSARKILTGVPDLERLLARLHSSRFTSHLLAWMNLDSFPLKIQSTVFLYFFHGVFFFFLPVVTS